MRLSVLLVLGVAVGLTGCAHFWRKDVSAATPDARRFDGKNAVIVRVVGRNKVLTVSSGARGVAYSVSGGDGRAMLSRGSMEELRRGGAAVLREGRRGGGGGGEGGGGGGAGGGGGWVGGGG